MFKFRLLFDVYRSKKVFNWIIFNDSNGKINE